MDRISTIVGNITMTIVFAIILILLFESISRTLFNTPNVWSIELSQFVMASYFIMGGSYTLMNNEHVRMDLFYHKWSPKKKALVDVCTFFIMLVYLSVLLYGSYKGLAYAIKYGQVSYSAWKPSMVPIKIIMTLGIALMFLQSIAELIKDVAVLRGSDIKFCGREEESA
jgi:TRAP-type mannitol/chloroaromatic compound transport system permease small subunit